MTGVQTCALPISSDDPWEVGKPTSLPCHGGTKCWATSLSSAGYSDCQTAELVSPTVDLSGCAGAGKTVTLAFWHEYKFEPKSMGKWWDGGLLQLSSDNGKTWSDVVPTPGYEGLLDGDYSPWTPVPDIAGHQGWSGTIPGGTWVQVKLDLAPAYLVATFRARWLVGADGNTTARGWGIDDVTITSP